MGGAQENHGLLTQNAQQLSMGQGRLHGGCDVRSTGAAWTVLFKLAMGVGCVGISQHCDTQQMMFSVTHGGVGPCLLNLLCR